MAESNIEQKTDIEEDIDISDAFKARLTLFNDTNLMEYVVVILSNVLQISAMQAYGLALRVHMSGKEVIKEGDDIHELKRLYNLLKEAKLTVTLE
jgi:ATP-dependent Clp protease adapter protein ClpS